MHVINTEVKAWKMYEIGMKLLLFLHALRPLDTTFGATRFESSFCLYSRQNRNFSNFNNALTIKGEL